MTTMLIAGNLTRESGSFMGDQLCALKTAYLFIQNQPDVDRVIMTLSPNNEMHFLWSKFLETHNVEVIWDDWNPGDWTARWSHWDVWRANRKVQLSSGETVEFDHYRELYLRIHGGIRQSKLCGHERGLNRKNIFEYWLSGQENKPDTMQGADWFDDTLCYHPPLTGERDVYIAPHCKTQGNLVFTFDYWSKVVKNLLTAGITVTVGYDGYFYDDEFGSNHLYKKHWGTHEQWFDEVCRHKIVACGNTGTGWVAAVCGVPMITMEPHGSVMSDHRYRECGLKNLYEVVDGYKLDEFSNDMSKVADYVAQRIIEKIHRKVVMTTGCYDVLHAGHVRHLQKARSLGTKLIVALNSDESVKLLKGPTRPINPQDQRKAVLEALRCVDEVRIFNGENAIPLIREIKPDVLAVGYGYTTETVIGRELLASWGGSAVVTYQSDAKEVNYPHDEPSTTKIVQRIASSKDITEICRLATSYSVNPFDKLRLMAQEFLKVIDSDVEGHVADLGTYKGGSALVLRRLAPDKPLHCFDTWEGTPYDDPLCHHKRGEWSSSLKDCKAVVGESIDTHYHKGVFPESTKEWGRGFPSIGNTFCFVYCDMDTYQATKDALEFFWPLMARGGKIVIDDYGWEPCAGVKKAVDEQCEKFEICLGKKIVQSQHTCILVKL